MGMDKLVYGQGVGNFAAPWVQAGTTKIFGENTRYGFSVYQPSLDHRVSRAQPLTE